MPNSSDFDPAEAVNFDQDKAKQKVRDEQAEEQRRQAQEEQRYANKLKLLRYAEEQLENIDNPVASEFVIEEWYVQPRLVMRSKYRRRKQAHYYGLWLTLSSTRGGRGTTGDNSITGLVKLQKPRAGYAFVRVHNIWDPRKVSCFVVHSKNGLGQLPYLSRSRPDLRRNIFLRVTSLEEAAGSPIHIVEQQPSTVVQPILQDMVKEYRPKAMQGWLGETPLESPGAVKEALNFAATGQSNPSIIERDYQW